MTFPGEAYCSSPRLRELPPEEIKDVFQPILMGNGIQVDEITAGAPACKSRKLHARDILHVRNCHAVEICHWEKQRIGICDEAHFRSRYVQIHGLRSFRNDGMIRKGFDSGDELVLIAIGAEKIQIDPE